jgi:arylformamidase
MNHPLPDPAWHDAQYNNRARIPEHPAILAHWADASARALAESTGMRTHAYGPDATELLDLYPARPGSAPAPVLVYLHGGYWRALGRRDQAFIAPPFTASGTVVVVPDYALCPAVTIGHIVGQLQRAIGWVHRHAAAQGADPSRIVVAGHSAGGHLAAMLLATDWPALGLPGGVVRHALALSGVFELEPLRHAPFLGPDLRLDAASAAALSPTQLPPPPAGHTLLALVGALESEEFLRQNRLIAERWGAAAVPVCETVPGCNHMDVLHTLADPSARPHRLLLDLLAGTAPSGAVSRSSAPMSGR